MEIGLEVEVEPFMESPDHNPDTDPNCHYEDRAMNSSSSNTGRTSECVRYLHFLQKNRNYRLYLIAHSMQHIGDWLIRVAAVLSVERLAPDSSTAISVIIICKLLPEILISPFGGTLSDKFERKYLMIFLDVMGAFTTLGFILALLSGNVVNLYILTLLRSSISSLYEPVTKSIYPMFMQDPEDLKRAATLNSISWATMLLLGGLVGGYVTAFVGVETCYALDSITFLISALTLLQIRGTFLAKPNADQENIGRLHECQNFTCVEVIKSKLKLVYYGVKTFFTMSIEFLSYLSTSGFVLCLFMKACGTLTWGTQDVLNASFTLVEGDEDETSKRLGLIYSCTGFGCLAGPFLANFVVQGSKPKTIQFVCICAFVFLTFGFMGISISPNFGVICFFTVLRSIGDSIIWMNATLLLQTLTSSEMLGRMISFEFSIARTSEAVMALTAGIMQDSGIDDHVIALISGLIGLTFLILWSVYHFCEGGAAQKRFNDDSREFNCTISSRVPDNELL